MLVYTIGTNTDTYITLTESTTLVAPYYLFIFENISTKVQYTVIVNSTSDLSEYPERYNRFAIDVATLFATAQAGQYLYDVYEQASAVNTNPTGLNLVETGRMLLKPATNLIKQGYEPQTTYKGYAG